VLDANTVVSDNLQVGMLNDNRIIICWKWFSSSCLYYRFSKCIYM